MIYGEGDSEGCVGIGDQRWRSNWVCRLYRGREKISVKEMCVKGDGEQGGCVDSYIKYVDHGLYFQ